MADDDRDLRNAFGSLALPPAPASLRTRLAVVAARPRVRPRPRRSLTLLAAAALIVLVGLAVAAGGLGPPTPTPTSGASPSGPPATTPSATAALSTVCNPWPPYKGVFIPTLTCEAAAKAAVGALPTGHPPITGITVQLGRYCPKETPCPSDLDLVTGYVMITFEGAPAVLVTVRGEPNSPVVVTGIGPTPTPSPTEIASSAPLPNPGGTCSASQFVVGTATSGYSFSTALTRHAYLNQPLRNAGGSCVLAVPAMIGLGSATGPFLAVRVNNVGYEVCVNNACHYLSPPSYTIRSGQSLTLGLSVSWWVGANDANGIPLYTPPPCPGVVKDVTHVEIPLASGTLLVDLETSIHEAGSSIPWRQVCSSTDSIPVTITTR